MAKIGAGDPLPLGISTATGRPLPGLSDRALAAVAALGRAPTPELPAQEARTLYQAGGLSYATVGEIDADDLSQAGWGVMFAPGVTPAVKEALAPLIRHRSAQAKPAVVFDSDAYRPNESAFDWLDRRNIRLDIVDPSQGVPFYLLLVGPPDALPFEFQYILDLYWAVGRLWFDSPAEFRRYAEGVVQYETGPAPSTSREIVLFAPAHDFDPATQLFQRQVAIPLRDGAGNSRPIGEVQGFSRRAFVGERATRANLAGILRGDPTSATPALLFTGSHGVVFKPGHELQVSTQGALVCQDWDRYGRIGPDHWFSAADVPDDARVHGLIHLLFACYGGATPEFDSFDRLKRAPRRTAPRPFLARLPQALLAHRRGAALAVLAHVERAWAYAFQSERGGTQNQAFRDVIARLLRGERIGQATDMFNLRWAALSTRLAEFHAEHIYRGTASERLLAHLWIARDDARNWLILGDPAVRLRVTELPEPLDSETDSTLKQTQGENDA